MPSHQPIPTWYRQSHLSSSPTNGVFVVRPHAHISKTTGRTPNINFHFMCQKKIIKILAFQTKNISDWFNCYGFKTYFTSVTYEIHSQNRVVDRVCSSRPDACLVFFPSMSIVPLSYGFFLKKIKTFKKECGVLRRVYTMPQS